MWTVICLRNIIQPNWEKKAVNKPLLCARFTLERVCKLQILTDSEQIAQSDRGGYIHSRYST